MSSPAGFCSRSNCHRAVSAGKLYCSELCATSGPRLVSGSQGTTSRPSYGGGQDDHGLLDGVTGAADTSVYVTRFEPVKPPAHGGRAGRAAQRRG